ncbi:FUN14 domain-containing protein 2 isoform X2 [Folsomia candida]|uniref:FUN14 domain-containing protein 2 isoform X2 n=1 Tax=Folsomia candida TaxID=158441 RepID=UPI000B8FEC2C|nr:FUN14 domain-containing protein 2 isoform X2 [Folsomia candida]
MPSATNNPKTPSENVESWIEKIVDGEEGSTPRQVFLGGVSGWLTGFLAMKVGKAAATAVGGGIILLQIANYKGYININWNRLNRDAEKIQKQIVTGAKPDWTDKIRTYAQDNSCTIPAFAGGFLLGLASA